MIDEGAERATERPSASAPSAICTQEISYISYNECNNEHQRSANFRLNCGKATQANNVSSQV